MPLLYVHDTSSTLSDQISGDDARDDHGELCSRRKDQVPGAYCTTRWYSVSSSHEHECMCDEAQEQSQEHSEEEVEGFHGGKYIIILNHFDYNNSYRGHTYRLINNLLEY